jgi:hypothetical protein
MHCCSQDVDVLEAAVASGVLVRGRLTGGLLTLMRRSGAGGVRRGWIRRVRHQ